MATWNSDGSVNGNNTSTGSVQYIHNNLAVDGDTITLPSGAFTWDAIFDCTKAITLQGQGYGLSTINEAASNNKIIDLSCSNSDFTTRLTGFSINQTVAGT